MGRVYSDNLVEIKDDKILFRRYYIPTFASKFIKLSSVEKIQIIKKTLFNTDFKVMGTDDFKTWYPFDSMRHKRKFIYMLFEKDKRRRIAFTVEDDEKFKSMIESQGVVTQS